MARYNEILVGRLNRFLQKFLGMKGPPPAPQLASDIQVALNLTSGIENRFLEAWLLFGANVQVAAAAAQNSAVLFRNPPASNVIAVIESILITNIQAAVIDPIVEAGVSPAANLGGVASVITLDRRAGATTGGTCALSGGNNAPGLVSAGATIYQPELQGVAGTNIELILYDNQQIPVAPGFSVLIRTSNLNVSLRAGMRWRERFLEDSERA